MRYKMSDITTTQFFAEVASEINDDKFSPWMGNHADELHLHCIAHIGDMGILEPYKVPPIHDLAKYFAHVWKISLVRIFETLTEQYEPLANTFLKEKVTHSGTDVTDMDTTNSSNVTSNTSTSSSTTFDSSTFHPVGKNENTSSAGGSGTMDNRYTHGHIIETERDGNIGTKPTQEMVGLEVDTRMNISLYILITDMLRKSFCNGTWYFGEDV